MARSRRRTKDPVQWTDAPEVREIARDLIQRYHGHLQGQPLNFLFRSTAAKGRGDCTRRYRIVGKGPLDVALSADPRWQGHQRFYVLEFARTLWNRWSPDEKAANVDLCLSQLVAGKTGGLQLYDLQLADYGRIVSRHGLFDHDITSLAKALKSQRSLDLDDEPSAEAGAPVDDSNLEYRQDTGEILNEINPLSVVEGGESAGDAAAQEQPADDALAGAAA